MKKAYVQTFGCQMNEHDSDRMKALLTREGYGLTEEVDEAKLVILNTCSVRANPENKVYSLLGRLKERKNLENDLIVGVGGCVAQQEGDRILKRDQIVDMVFGPDNFFSLPEMISEVQEGKRVLRTKWLDRDKKVQNFIPDEEIENVRVEGPKAYLSITKGCDNFCTFCVVPFTRGRLVSREPENIFREAEAIVAKGAKEIWLLGQNVNSYGTPDFGFDELLKGVADLDGVERVRFTSPHPNDWNNQLSDLMASHPNIANQLHLPFQAGSDRILQNMNRVHKIEDYLDKMRYLKDEIPGVAIGTDLIVGFPGETDEDFEKTLDVMREVKFRQVYAYKYSPRPHTKAIKWEDNVPREVKNERLARVLALHEETISDYFTHDVGKNERVLIENADPKTRGAMSGRTEGNTQVTVMDCEAKVGDIVNVEITEARRHSLAGRLIASSVV